MLFSLATQRNVPSVFIVHGKKRLEKSLINCSVSDATDILALSSQWK
ncbi:hypothetical protein [Vibrio vulnificus YJ016]|uniref:Uncharacterized protein n=1 Tax=Vibrio vulnificus (strain YJ016) TaxID=196600 RepID=Q7MC64_VIBVY|nr:hypothetical protein [Vibrio vulnificus YJ016]